MMIKKFVCFECSFIIKLKLDLYLLIYNVYVFIIFYKLRFIYLEKYDCFNIYKLSSL